jgi:hypothetical protein
MFGYFHRSFVVCFSILWFAVQGHACFQPSQYVEIHARILEGIVTREGKPVEAMRVSLYQANYDDDFVGNMSLNKMRRRKLTETETDKDGNFAFRNLASGRYEIVATSGNGLLEFTVIKDDKNQSLMINSFGDGCLSFAARPEPQRKPKS